MVIIYILLAVPLLFAGFFTFLIFIIPWFLVECYAYMWFDEAMGGENPETDYVICRFLIDMHARSWVRYYWAKASCYISPVVFGAIIPIAMSGYISNTRAFMIALAICSYGGVLYSLVTLRLSTSKYGLKAPVVIAYAKFFEQFVKGDDNFRQRALLRNKVSLNGTYQEKAQAIFIIAVILGGVYGCLMGYLTGWNEPLYNSSFIMYIITAMFLSYYMFEEALDLENCSPDLILTDDRKDFRLLKDKKKPR